MNAISDPQHGDPVGGAQSTLDSGPAPDAIVHTLRRTGRRAVRFDGWQLIEATGPRGQNQVWHDLNLYRTVANDYIIEMIVSRRELGAQPIHRIGTYRSLGDAAIWLEHYRPSDDIPIPAGLAVADMALPWAILQAVQLRQEITKLELSYRALVSEVFEALDLTDNPEPELPATVDQATTSSAQ
jgi:hypothetical protein